MWAVAVAPESIFSLLLIKKKKKHRENGKARQISHKNQGKGRNGHSRQTDRIDELQASPAKVTGNKQIEGPQTPIRAKAREETTYASRPD